MQPLPAPVPGQPLFDRVDGHLQLGLTERGYDGSPNGFGPRSDREPGGIVRARDRRDAAAGPGLVGAGRARPAGRRRASLPLAARRPLQRARRARGAPDPHAADRTALGAVEHGRLHARLCAAAGPAHAADFAAFAAAVAHRYPLAAAIEIWNETNNHHGSVQGPRPAEYAALLARSYDAIKAARPAMRVLGGSLGAYGASSAQPTTDATCASATSCRRCSTAARRRTWTG